MTMRTTFERNEASMKKIFAILCALVLVVSAMSVMAFAAEGDTVLFEGEREITASWTVDPENVNNVRLFKDTDFDPTIFVEGGYFTVTYTGDTADAVYLVLQDWDEGVWGQMGNATSCSSEGNVHTSTFSYADCVAATSGKALSGTDSIYAAMTATGPITITNVTWHAPASTEPTTPDPTTPDPTTPDPTTPDPTTPDPTTPDPTTPPVKEDVVSKLFSGSHEITSHWNWDGMPLKVSDIGFDASAIAAGGYFRVTYTGTAPDAIYLVVVDDDSYVEGKDNHFVQLDNAESCTKNADGSYTSIFSFSQLAGANAEKNLDLTAIDFVRIGWNNNGEGSIVVSDVSWVTPGGSSQTGDSSVIVIASVAVLASVIGMVAIVSKRRFAA